MAAERDSVAIRCERKILSEDDAASVEEGGLQTFAAVAKQLSGKD